MPGAYYRYQSGNGLSVYAPSEYSGMVDSTSPDPSVFSGADLLALSAGQFTSVSALRAAKRLARLALGALLGPKPLVSREMFR